MIIITESHLPFQLMMMITVNVIYLETKLSYFCHMYMNLILEGRIINTSQESHSNYVIWFICVVCCCCRCLKCVLKYPLEINFGWRLKFHYVYMTLDRKIENGWAECPYLGSFGTWEAQAPKCRHKNSNVQICRNYSERFHVKNVWNFFTVNHLFGINILMRSLQI